MDFIDAQAEGETN